MNQESLLRLANSVPDLGLSVLRDLLAQQRHQAFLDELVRAQQNADSNQIDYLKALGGEGLHLLLRTEASAPLLTTYADLVLEGRVHAPLEGILALYERTKIEGLIGLARSMLGGEGSRVSPRRVASQRPDTERPALQVKRVIQILDMGFTSFQASDALGIRRSVFRSEQERTFLQALALRFPALHAFPNYPLDQLADFSKLKEILDAETLEFGRHCRIDAVLVVPGEGDPVAAFELDSPLHDDPGQVRRDRLRNRLFKAIQIPFFRLCAEDCSSVGIDEWYALLSDEVAAKIDCGRRLRVRTPHSTFAPT